jgi:hypothetical protein
MELVTKLSYAQQILYVAVQAPDESWPTPYIDTTIFFLSFIFWYHLHTLYYASQYFPIFLVTRKVFRDYTPCRDVYWTVDTYSTGQEMLTAMLIKIFQLTHPVHIFTFYFLRCPELT